MKVYPDYHAALISLTKAEQSQFDYVRGDSEGFVNIPLSIKGVIFSCFLREDTEKPMIKISLRSVGTFPSQYSWRADVLLVGRAGRFVIASGPGGILIWNGME